MEVPNHFYYVFINWKRWRQGMVYGDFAFFCLLSWPECWTLFNLFLNSYSLLFNFDSLMFILVAFESVTKYSNGREVFEMNWSPVIWSLKSRFSSNYARFFYAESIW